MKSSAKKYILSSVLGAFCTVCNAEAFSGTLSAENFNKMYYVASLGRIDILRQAMSRGLNINAVNSGNDTGLCVAVKRKNYTAYKSFRLVGANPKPACLYRIPDEYKEFLATYNLAPAEESVAGVATATTATTTTEAAAGTAVAGATIGTSAASTAIRNSAPEEVRRDNDRKYLYYNGENEGSWWPWIIGGALVGGGVYWWHNHKHHGHSDSSSGGSSVIPGTVGYGLAGYIDKYARLVNNGTANNQLVINATNPKADEYVDSIEFLPNILDNYKYLQTYVKAINGASFYNLSGGDIYFGNASVGLSSYQQGSTVVNNGKIDVQARNGSIGMVASNGASAINGSKDGGGATDDNAIRLVFNGSQEGDTVIGMYADTHSTINNYGKIIGIASQSVSSNAVDNLDLRLSDVQDLYNLIGEGNGGSGDDNNKNSGGSAEEQQKAIANNSGTILGMSLFDFYTGSDLSSYTVTAENNGSITLQAGNNNATKAATSLIGMGSYLDDRFLNGMNNPSFAEQMNLKNLGVIDLAYQKTYNISSEALKLGNGGVIGMRADASTDALNKGTIKVDMRATTINSNEDVAAGMLSLHGAQLVNGTTNFIYKGTSANTGGTIQMLNEASSGGVFYGMLAAKGSGAQTGLYKWQEPSLYNYGLIDMQVSDSYAMASFAGGEIVNDGVINLGVENGQSYYKNDKGLYAAGEDITEEVSLINNGIINVNAEESSAIYNEFSGSVTQTNTGYIYLSNKATNSQVFGGNYSTAINEGNILYKVGNSNKFKAPSGRQSDIGFNVKTSPAASVIVSSGDSTATKQYVVNDETGMITIGEARDPEVDYGGTFGTAGIQVSKQGSARNKGLMHLKLFDEDIMQFNVAMWLDSSTTAESFAENFNTIKVDSANSIGIRNDSQGGASAANYGVIYASGAYNYGMAATAIGANLFNGHAEPKEGEEKLIRAEGYGSIGMYVKNAQAWNYGTIQLLGDATTAFQLDGANSNVLESGNIEFVHGLDDITFFWMTNGAALSFDYDSVVIDGYTLARATTDSSGGMAYFSKSSTAYVTGENSHLFIAEGNGSGVYNRGKVEVYNGAKAMIAKKGGIAYNDMRSAQMTIKDATSTGIFAEDSGSQIVTAASSKIVVEAGEGLHAEGLASVFNNGNIEVQKDIGIHLLDGNASSYTEGTNTGKITITSSQATGAKVVDGAHFINSGEMKVSNGGTGIYTDSTVANESGGNIEVNAGSVGIRTTSGTKYTTNSGTIDVKGSGATGVIGGITNSGTMYVSSANAYAVDGEVVNSGTIEVWNGGVGVNGTATNSGTISVYDGKGVVGSITNNGSINVESGVGVYGTGNNGSGGIITTTGDAAVQVTGTFKNSGTISGTGVGVDLLSGSFTNKKDIIMSSGMAIRVGNGTNALSTGSITVNNGYGFYIKNGGSGTNSNIGTITIGQGYGFYVANGGMGSNAGTISLSGSGYGAYVENGGTFTNSGKISYHSKKDGRCANIGVGGECIDEDEEKTGTAVINPVVMEEGATFINNGTVDLSDIHIDFDDGGNYVLGNGGTYRAESLSGHIEAGTDIVEDGFDNTYTKEDAFVGKNEGISVDSQSYMFDAKIDDKGDSSDVVLTRRNFKDLVEEQKLADFFELNYQAKNNEKMYQAMKSARNADEFDVIAESESGKKFYANLPRENMAVLRGIQHQEQKRVLEDGVHHTTLSANYFRTGKDGYGDLSNYEDDVYSATLGGGTRLNRHWSIGGSLTAAYADSSYGDINSSRENKILMALMPIMYQNSRFTFLTTPSIGAGFGSYKRKTLANKYEADTFDIYYGLYNHAEYSVDMKIAELVTEAELNLQGISSDDAKEKGWVKVHGQDTTSLEAGIGVKLRKRIKLSNERELMLALGTKYYHEILDPYDDIIVGTNAASYPLKGYDENKNRLRTAAEAMYKEGDFRLSAEIAHNAEKESNVEGGVGVWYNF